MKQINKLFSLFMLVALLFTGCSEFSEDAPERLADPLAGLTDNPPAEGMCAGWRKSLAIGRRIHDVEYCLREKALRDRPAAVAEAEVLLGWQITEDDYSMLKPVLMALSNYPQPGSLEQYLTEQSLLPNLPDEYSQLEVALTVSDFVSVLGNIYWLDVETGVFPNNHDYLLAGVAALSELHQAQFTEQPPNDYDAGDEPYLLRAQFRGKSYQQAAENYGDWYDVSAVLRLLNRIAVDQALDDRFMSLPTGDQTAIIWVVGAQKLTQLQTEGLIRLSAAELSMQTGKAFEQEVRENYDNVQ